MADPVALLAAAWRAFDLPSPEARGAAMLRARPSPALSDALAPDRWVAEQSFKPDHDALAARGVETHAALPAEAGPFPVVAVLADRARARTLSDLSRAWDLCAPGGVVLCAGAKTDGIEGVERALKRAGLTPTARPGGHGRVLLMARTETGPPAPAEWRAAAARAPRATLSDGAPAVTEAGVFSWDGADPASALLAATLPPLSGRVADLGAGWGFLAPAVLASAAVDALDLVEADLAALDCARANVADPRAAFHWADARASGLAEGRCDAVLSNPPFHAGRAVDRGLGESFIAAAARLLKPSGVFWMVANRGLPYERALDAAFAEVEEAGGDRGRRVMRAARPRRSKSTRR
ncbi:MAG: methyltransferase [Pseudomonadota bacterium]